MGKQTRRKRNRNKNNNNIGSRNQSSNRSTTTTNNNNNDNNSNTQSKNALIQQIRHGDAKTRQTALIALQGIILDNKQSLSSSSSSKQKINIDLLQAIREQVMDSNLECARAAAQCLTLFCCRDNNSYNEENMAGWTLIFLGRLEQCLQGITSNNNNNNNNKGTAKNNKKSSSLSFVKHWYALSVPCLEGLCKLIETNPFALERIMNYGGAGGGKQQVLLSTMFGFIDTTASSISSSRAVASSSSSTTDVKLQESKHQVMVYAARIIHSSLDDNTQLLQAFNDMPDTWTNYIIIHNNNNNDNNNPVVPLLAQLHLAGSIVLARQMQHHHQSITDITKWQALVINIVLPVLIQTISTIWNESSWKELQAQYMKAHTLWQEQKLDQEMEDQVIRAVQERKEPARDIAKRQKEKKQQKEQLQKQKQQQQQGGDDDMDATMKVDDDNNKSNQDSQQELRQDGQQVMEDLLETWNDKILMPFQLSLEVLANVISICNAPPPPLSPVDETNNNKDEHDMMVEDIQQEQCSPLDIDLSQHLQQQLQLPKKLLQLFQQIHQHYQATLSSTTKETLAFIVNDVSTILSKITACLGNCVFANMYESSNNDNVELANLWNTMKSCITSIDGASNVMVLVTKQYKLVQEQVLSVPDLNDLLQLLLSSFSDCNDSTMKQDLINIMGIACSSVRHSKSINQQVTKTLLQVLTTATNDNNKAKHNSAIPFEVLNAIIDMYSQDDVHPQVFLELQVLNHFQTCISMLQQQQNDLSPEKEEILWNGTQFVEYKKQQQQAL